VGGRPQQPMLAPTGTSDSAVVNRLDKLGAATTPSLPVSPLIAMIVARAPEGTARWCDTVRRSAPPVRPRRPVWKRCRHGQHDRWRRCRVRSDRRSAGSTDDMTFGPCLWEMCIRTRNAVPSWRYWVASPSHPPLFVSPDRMVRMSWCRFYLHRLGQDAAGHRRSRVAVQAAGVAAPSLNPQLGVDGYDRPDVRFLLAALSRAASV